MWLQVTYQTDVASGDAQLRHLSLGDLDLTLFTHSFLGYGQDAAHHLALRLSSSRLSTTLPAVEQVAIGP